MRLFDGTLAMGVKELDDLWEAKEMAFRKYCYNMEDASLEARYHQLKERYTEARRNYFKEVKA